MFIRCKLYYYAKNAPSTPTFEYSIFRSNCSHPYLLGFNSNLVPNMCNFDISAVSLRKFRIFRVFGDICVSICTLS